jgi:hypothetical protein
MRERVLAEAEPTEGVIYRVIKEDTYRYTIQRTKGNVTTSNVKPSFEEAMGIFMDAVNAELATERRN